MRVDGDIMYEFIRGKLDYVCPEYITVEASGVGYQILAPNPFSFTDKMNTQTTIYVHQHVREDFIGLYGFATREERKLFLKLLNVTGIGPKGALAIIAAGDMEALVSAIEAEDEKYLVKFPGVGKKTARQIILDLKGKLGEFGSIGLFADSKILEAKEVGNPHLEEATLALQALGYSDKELSKIKKSMESEDLATEGYIKLALKLMLK